MISGILTLLSFIAFLGVCAWAWSGRRRAQFDEAAALPLQDNATPHQEQP